MHECIEERFYEEKRSLLFSQKKNKRYFLFKLSDSRDE